MRPVLSTVRGGAERWADLQETDLGWPSRYLVAPELALTPERFQRQPEIGENLSRGFFDELVALEVVHLDGRRRLDDDLSQAGVMDDAARFVEANLESNLAWLAASQLRVVWRPTGTAGGMPRKSVGSTGGSSTEAGAVRRLRTWIGPLSV